MKTSRPRRLIEKARRTLSRLRDIVSPEQLRDNIAMSREALGMPPKTAPQEYLDRQAVACRPLGDVSTASAAMMLSVSRISVCKLVQSKELNAGVVDGELRIDESSVLSYVARRRREAEQPPAAAAQGPSDA